MKFIAISDTHGLHRDLVLPSGDVIIHAGDFCDRGSERHMHDFLAWYDSLDYAYKFLIGGNHDSFAARHPEQFKALLSPEMVYLNDSGFELKGLKFWGSPVQPDLVGWAFGKRRGAQMKVHWDLVPEDTDILITHTPPYGVLDKSRMGRSLGCEELSKKLPFIRPKVHVFGHVHAGYGQETIGDTLHINAANIASGRGLVNKPVVFEVG